MKVVLIPGPRNEEVIAEILEAKSRMDGEEWEEYLLDCASRGDKYSAATNVNDARRASKAPRASVF